MHQMFNPEIEQKIDSTLSSRTSRFEFVQLIGGMSSMEAIRRQSETIKGQVWLKDI